MSELIPFSMRHAGALPFSTERLVSQARAMAGAGDHLGAARVYQVAFDVDPDDLKLGLRLAYHYSHAGQTSRAARVYLQCARIYGRLGHAQRARILAQRAVSMDASVGRVEVLIPVVRAVGRSLVPVLCAVADTHATRGDLDQARQVLSLAVQADPTRVAAARRLADIELALGNVDEARRVLDEAVRGLLRLGRTSEFLELADRLLALSPDDRFVLRAVAHTHLRAGRARAALPRLQAMIRVEPRDRHTVLTLAEVHAGLRERKAGLAALARYAWLRLCDGRRHREEVAATLRRARRWWPDDAGWRDGIEQVLERCWEQHDLGAEDLDIVVLSAPPPPPPLPCRLSA